LQFRTSAGQTNAQDMPQASLFMQNPHPLYSCTGTSDFVDGLTVATDLLHKAIEDRPMLEKDNIIKRIVLVSNFLDAVSLCIPLALELYLFGGMQGDCGLSPEVGVV
jgi:hypothetical protein